jgi:hypothetical protein
MPYAKRWEKPIARLPLISFLLAFSITALGFLKLVDVDAKGWGVLVDVVLIASLGSFLLSFFAVAYFVLTGAVERSANEDASHPISWRGIERVLLLVLIAALALKLFVQ